MKLSQRLNLIKYYALKYKQGDDFGDIGTDHAYLPCALVLEAGYQHGYACDITAGPIQKAKETISKYGLSQRIKVLQGDGLAPLIKTPPSIIFIAGMGAYNIRDIIKDKQKQIKKDQLFILQPNNDTDILRSYLLNNNFSIIDEGMIEEGNHYYDILVVRKRPSEIRYSAKHILLGTNEGLYQTDIFKKRWTKQVNILKKVLISLDINHPDYPDLSNKIGIIEEEL